MISYNIDYKPSVKRDWKRISKGVASQIVQAINGLKAHPHPPQSTQLSPPFQDMYRLKVSGSYRVAYSVDDHTRTITIHMIGTRQNFYSQLRQRLLRN